ncbi:MAG: hypothetical protein M5U09_25150 [Gammaproteobacteria bacterium]|nr:hypothetical protein [Gammaproteobacteria bacterium]
MRDRQFDVYRITTRRDSRSKNQTYGLMNVADGTTQTPGEVVDLFSAGRGSPTAPTANSPQENPLENQGSTVSAVSTVSDSRGASMRAGAHAGAIREPKADPPQTPHPPQPTEDIDLADFDPQEEES